MMPGFEAGAAAQHSGSTQPQYFSPRLPAVPQDVPERPRLVRLLEDSVASSGLVLMVASEGTGKTTVAAQWGRQHTQRPVIWLNAEDSGGNGWDFYVDLVDELDAAELLGEDEKNLGGAGAPRPLRRMGTVLSRQLQRCGTEAVVVVERAHRLTEEALDLITRLAHRGTLRFLLLALWLDEDFIFEAQDVFHAPRIGDADLQLTEAEILSSLELAGLTMTDAEVIRGISSPLMLQAMVYRAREQRDSVITAETARNVRHQLNLRLVRRLLAENTPAQDQRLLLRLAFPPMLDEQLTADLLGMDGSGARRVLRRLRDAGHGEFHEEGTFYLDPALVEGLRELALERIEPAELRRVYVTISVWCEHKGHIRQALQFAVRAESWEQIATLTLLHFNELQHVAREELSSILDRATPELIRQRPYLGWFRLVLLAGRPETTVAALTAVGDHTLSMLDPDARGLHRLINQTITFAYHYMLGDFHHAEEIIADLLPRVEGLAVQGESVEVPPDQRFVLTAAQGWVVTAMRQFAANTKLLLGHYTDALSLIEPIVYSLTDEQGGFSWRNLHSAGIKALIHAASGNINAARRTLSWIHSFELPPAWDESYFGAPACIASAYVSLADRRPQTATAELDRLKHHQGGTEYWAHILDARARITAYFEEPGMVSYVAAELAARGDRPPTSPYMQVQLLTRAAAVAFSAGTLTTASRYLDQARDADYPGRPGVSIERAVAVLALYEEDWLKARDIASDILENTSITLREEISMRLCWVQAELGLVEEGFPDADSTTAGRHFMAALALADECGSPYDVMIISPRWLTGLLKEYAPDRHDLAEAMHGDAESSSPEGRQEVQLTDSEHRVLEELAQAESRAVIARRLAISENTVKTHLRRIYRKLGVRSRAEALERAYASGLFLSS
ncbi:LuxR family transcriptional regulator [Nesterenkonia muleiensis]|uniref:LuxR family transcriptional regulator n=1 Tax=Nesterenkonia muleiensis TaxID=2282648 RepID=UPI000E76A985|nr:LuxR family transcriptional regulator [Nesterenkonia muleiensis]